MPTVDQLVNARAAQLISNPVVRERADQIVRNLAPLVSQSGGVKGREAEIFGPLRSAVAGNEAPPTNSSAETYQKALVGQLALLALDQMSGSSELSLVKMYLEIHRDNALDHLEFPARQEGPRAAR